MASLPDDFDPITGVAQTSSAGYAQFAESADSLIFLSALDAYPADGFGSWPLRANALLLRSGADPFVLEQTEGLSLHGALFGAETMVWSLPFASHRVSASITAFTASPPGALERFELPVGGDVVGLQEFEVTRPRLYATEQAVAWAPPIRRRESARDSGSYAAPWNLAARDRLFDAVSISPDGLHSVLGFDREGRLLVVRAETSSTTRESPVWIQFLDTAGIVQREISIPICGALAAARVGYWRCVGRGPEAVREFDLGALYVGDELLLVTHYRFGWPNVGTLVWRISEGDPRVVAEAASWDLRVSNGQLFFLEGDASENFTAARFDPSSDLTERRDCDLGELSGRRKCFSTALGAVIVREMKPEELRLHFGDDIDPARGTSAAYLRPFESDEEILLGDLCPLSQPAERCASGPVFELGRSPSFADIRDKDGTLFAIEFPGSPSTHDPARRRLLRID